MFALTTPFWSLFDQKASTWVIQGKAMVVPHDAWWWPSWLVAHYVLRGQLEAVLPSYREQPSPIHVIWPTAVHMPAKTRCAIDALVAGTPSCLAGS